MSTEPNSRGLKIFGSVPVRSFGNGPAPGGRTGKEMASRFRQSPKGQIGIYRCKGCRPSSRGLFPERGGGHGFRGVQKAAGGPGAWVSMLPTPGKSFISIIGCPACPRRQWNGGGGSFS